MFGFGKKRDKKQSRNNSHERFSEPVPDGYFGWNKRTVEAARLCFQQCNLRVETKRSEETYSQFSYHAELHKRLFIDMTCPNLKEPKNRVSSDYYVNLQKVRSDEELVSEIAEVRAQVVQRMIGQYCIDCEFVNPLVHVDIRVGKNVDSQTLQEIPSSKPLALPASAITNDNV